MVEFQLDDSEIVQALAQVEETLDPLMAEAAAMGADIVANRAKSVHDYEDQTGHLTNSIMRVKTEGSFLAGTLQAEVAAGAKHGIFIEDGTNPTKPIRPRHRKALRWPVEGGYAFSKGHIPGPIKAREFLANALEHELDDVAEIFEDAAELAFMRAGLR